MCLWSFSHKFYTDIAIQSQHSYVICLYRKKSRIDYLFKRELSLIINSHCSRPHNNATRLTREGKAFHINKLTEKVLLTRSLELKDKLASGYEHKPFSTEFSHCELQIDDSWIQTHLKQKASLWISLRQTSQN